MPKIDWENYKENIQKEFKKATPGTYTLIPVADAEGITYKGSTFVIKKEGPSQGQEVAKFKFVATISGGEFDGQKAFGEINTMSRSWRDGSSSLQDYIQSAKSNYRPESTEALVAEIQAFPPKPYGIEKVVTPFIARTTWQWYCKECRHVFLEGYLKAKAPKNYEGPAVVVAKTGNKPNEEQACPSCGDSVRATVIMIDYLTKAAPLANGAKSTATKPTVTLPPAAG